jgi:Large ribosomal RNA subunit accumulation protein YceD
VSEFERFFDLRQLPAAVIALHATPAECAALAARFGLVAVERLDATIVLGADGPAVRAEGRLQAAIVQNCAVSGEDLAVRIDEPVSLRFVPAEDAPASEEEIELQGGEPDEIEFDGSRFDLGEALAQGLALAIDPFAAGPGADEARRRAGLLGEAEAGPFAALAKLRKPS